MMIKSPTIIIPTSYSLQGSKHPNTIILNVCELPVSKVMIAYHISSRSVSYQITISQLMNDIDLSMNNYST